jgi:hypothetical protein
MASVSSADGNYTASVTMVQDPDGTYVVEVAVATSSAGSGDTIVVRVNGHEAWRGLASESSGG